MDIQNIPLDVAEWDRRGPFGKTRLYELIATNEIKAVKLGRKTLISPSEIFGYIDRHAKPIRLKAMPAPRDAEAV